MAICGKGSVVGFIRVLVFKLRMVCAKESVSSSRDAQQQISGPAAKTSKQGIVLQSAVVLHNLERLDISVNNPETGYSCCRNNTYVENYTVNAACAAGFKPTNLMLVCTVGLAGHICIRHLLNLEYRRPVLVVCCYQEKHLLKKCAGKDLKLIRLAAVL